MSLSRNSRLIADATVAQYIHDISPRRRARARPAPQDAHTVLRADETEAGQPGPRLRLLQGGLLPGDGQPLSGVRALLPVAFDCAPEPLCS